MKEGKLLVDVGEVQEPQPKELNKSSKIVVTVSLVLIFTLLFIVLLVCLSIHDYGEYKTAQEYVDNLVVVKSVKPVQDSLISSWYGDEIEIVNCSSYTVKYVRYELKAYNMVGEYIKTEFDKTTFRITGPIKSGESGTYSGDRIYYSSSSIKGFKIVSFSVEFMDGKTIKYDKDMISYLNKEI